MADTKYWIGFSLIPGIGHVRLAQLENYFGNLEDAWRAAPADLKNAGLDKGSVRAIGSWQPKISLQEEMEKLERYGVTVPDISGPARVRRESRA